MQKLISLILPCYNEALNLEALTQELLKVLIPLNLSYSFELIFINDGSTDHTLDLLQQLKVSLPVKVIIIDLSRNFGKEIALSAGLDYAQGEAAIVLDADLQDPPQLIPEFIAHWEQGYQIVYGRRTSRNGESLMKKITAFFFYRLLNKLGTIAIPVDSGDFRLIDKKALQVLKQLREKHRYMKGLFAWLGFKQKAVDFIRPPRYQGVSKWNYLKLINLAIEGITSFSLAPLKLATLLGIVSSLLAFSYGLWIIYKTIVFGENVAGYPSLMVAILFLGGIQLFTLGIIGEYLGRTFDESKNRPLYIIKDIF